MPESFTDWLQPSQNETIADVLKAAITYSRLENLENRLDQSANKRSYYNIMADNTEVAKTESMRNEQHRASTSASRERNWLRSRGRGRRNRWRPYCVYCRRVGHSDDRCYYQHVRDSDRTGCHACAGTGYTVGPSQANQSCAQPKNATRGGKSRPR